MAVSLELSEDNAYTCETAEHFFLNVVLHRWEQFRTVIDIAKANLTQQQEDDALTREQQEAALIEKHFPFMKFFEDVQPLFAGSSYEVLISESVLHAFSCCNGNQFKMIFFLLTFVDGIDVLESDLTYCRPKWK